MPVTARAEDSREIRKDLVPEFLKNRPNFTTQGQKKYLYPHDFKGNWVKQDYLPPELAAKRWYFPQSNKTEEQMAQYWQQKKGQKHD